MTREKALSLGIVSVLVATGVFYYFYRSNLQQRERERLVLEAETAAPIAAVEESEKLPEKIELLVYSTGTRRPGRPFERKVEVDLVASQEPKTLANQIAGAAVKEIQYLAPGVSVEQVFLLNESTAIVDFSSQISNQIKGGVTAEYSILLTVARSLIHNLEELEEVRFLVGGMEQATLGGHVSLADPFR